MNKIDVHYVIIQFLILSYVVVKIINVLILLKTLLSVPTFFLHQLIPANIRLGYKMRWNHRIVVIIITWTKSCDLTVLFI